MRKSGSTRSENLKGDRPIFIFAIPIKGEIKIIQPGEVR